MNRKNKQIVYMVLFFVSCLLYELCKEIDCGINISQSVDRAVNKVNPNGEHPVLSFVRADGNGGVSLVGVENEMNMERLSSPEVEREEAFGDSDNLPYIPEVLEMDIGFPSYIYKEEPPWNYSSEDPPLKKILFWNRDVLGNRNFQFGFGRDPFLYAKCRFNNCFTTSNRSLFREEEVDAVIWNLNDIDDRSFPKQRSAHTRYVFWDTESPAYLQVSLRNFHFNWTWTYRMDSDFPHPYGQVFRLREPLKVAPEHDYAQGKTHLAAWFVSHCETVNGREKYIENLKHWIPIEIFGNCGDKMCPKNQYDQCRNMLQSTYKFYFALENSICKDYITEKFFDILRLDIVPVVYGPDEYAKHAPPHSFIDIRRFPSAKTLADYLIYLDQNDTAYNEYFQWKSYYTVVQAWRLIPHAFCDLCERLHTDSTTKTYNLHQWFMEESHCLTKDDPEIKALISGN